MFRFFIVVTCFFVAACDARQPSVELAGETMGTTYRIVISDIPKSTDLEDVSSDVESTLQIVDDLSSNWNPNSEISRINSTDSLEPIQISQEMFDLIKIANEVHIQSDGAFDTTLAPVIEIWGFGKSESDRKSPTSDEIEEALRFVGQLEQISISEAPLTLQKSSPEISIHLAGYAKGYGIDEIARTLETNGITNYYVDVGGDLIVSGQSPRADLWTLGIEKPILAPSKVVEEVVHLTNSAMATSGDYRNFFMENGVRYSHIIDPKTGRPITHNTASVTVITETAVLADAWATALLVLGSENGLKIANKFKIASLFIDGEQNGNAVEYKVRTSAAFDALETSN